MPCWSSIFDSKNQLDISLCSYCFDNSHIINSPDLANSPWADSTRFDFGRDLFRFRGLNADLPDDEIVIKGHSYESTRGFCRIEISPLNKKIIQLKYSALARKKYWSPLLDEHYLKRFLPENDLTENLICPVLELPCTIGKHLSSDWSVDRICNEIGYVPHNVCVISQGVNARKADLSPLSLFKIAYATREKWPHPSDPEYPSPEECKKLVSLFAPVYYYYFEPQSEISLIWPQIIAPANKAELPLHQLLQLLILSDTGRYKQYLGIAQDYKKVLKTYKRLLTPQMRSAHNELISKHTIVFTNNVALFQRYVDLFLDLTEKPGFIDLAHAYRDCRKVNESKLG